MNGPAPVTIRPAGAADLPAVLAINQDNLPAVGPVTPDRLAHFLAVAELFLVAVDDAGAVVGYVIVLDEHADYDSPNYRWFRDRYDRFLYVDRIAVAAAARGGRIAWRFYDAAVERVRATGRRLLCAEVNVEPRNDVSLAFHDRYGFRTQAEVADPRYERLRVAMLTLEVDRTAG